MWYQNLHKSKLTPPNFVFNIVWPILYMTIIISIILYYLKMKNKMWTSLGFLFFIIQFVLNIIWAPIFFYGHQILLSFFVILLLIVFISLTIFEFHKENTIAACILFPYLLWTIYASYLNLYICIHN